VRTRECERLKAKEAEEAKEAEGSRLKAVWG
jgi:hypothetical protein